MKKGFCYQENTRYSQAVACSREKFWREVRKAANRWAIDSRRAILAAVEQKDEAAIQKWMSSSEFQKFLEKKHHLKRESARKKFFEKSQEDQLLAFAQELKDNLTAFIFSCYEFDATATAKSGTTFRRRKLADCHLNGLAMLDIDHVENPVAIWECLKQHEELMQRTKLVHITSSERGIRIIFTADVKVGNLADNQIAFAEALGYQADSSCIDATRNSFAPKEEDILFIEDSIFEYYDEAFDKKYTNEYRKGNTQPLHYQFPNQKKEAKKQRSAAVSKKKEQKQEAAPVTWRGHSVQAIIDARFAEKLPCAEDSNRHNESLKLASDLLVLFDGDKQKTLQVLQAQPWVQEIIDERDEDVEQTVESAAERMAEREKKYLTQSPSKPMQAAIKQATGKTYAEIISRPTPNPSRQGGEAGAAASGNAGLPLGGDIEGAMMYWGAQIEALFPDFPILKDICKGLKRNQYPAAVFVAGGLMMTLMTRCTYRFYHRPEELRRLNCSALIIGDPASGKSFATRLFDLIASPILEADNAGKEAINAYREIVKTRGANKEKPKKPKVVVREHPARTSNAQFIQDMVNAVEIVDGIPMQLHMLTFDTELDNTLSVQKSGGWIDKMAMELKAFHNEVDGQAYSNADSIMQNFKVIWNYIYTGTPNALKKKVNASNFGSGLATRLTVIPLPTTNFEMLEREKEADFEADARLKLWAQKLDRMKGELSVGKIVDELYNWTARRMMDAKDNDSRADEMLLKRCAYHGLNFSAPFIVMRHWDCMKEDGSYFCGEFETDDTDWRLAELLVNIQYACQRHFFGPLAEEYFEQQNHEASIKYRRNPKTIEAFERLPKEFTIEDVMRCFGSQNLTGARLRTYRLIDDKLVVKAGNITVDGRHIAMYRKTGNYMI